MPSSMAHSMAAAKAGPCAAVVGPEDADRDELGGRCDGVDDPGAGRSVADQVGRPRIVLDDAGSSPIELDPQAADEAPADRGMVRLDARSR